MQEDQQYTYPTVRTADLYSLFQDAPLFVSQHKCYSPVEVTAEHEESPLYAFIEPFEARALQTQMQQPVALETLVRHADVVEILSPAQLEQDAVLTGPANDWQTKAYLQRPFAAIVLEQGMRIPSISDTAEFIDVHPGSILILDKLIGIYPYAKGHSQAQHTARFLSDHKPVSAQGQILDELAESPRHQQFEARFHALHQGGLELAHGMAG